MHMLLNSELEGLWRFVGIVTQATQESCSLVTEMKLGEALAKDGGIRLLL